MRSTSKTNENRNLSNSTPIRERKKQVVLPLSFFRSHPGLREIIAATYRSPVNKLNGTFITYGCVCHEKMAFHLCKCFIINPYTSLKHHYNCIQNTIFQCMFSEGLHSACSKNLRQSSEITTPCSGKNLFEFSFFIRAFVYLQTSPFLRLLLFVFCFKFSLRLFVVVAIFTLIVVL